MCSTNSKLSTKRRPSAATEARRVAGRLRLENFILAEVESILGKFKNEYKVKETDVSPERTYNNRIK